MKKLFWRFLCALCTITAVYFFMLNMSMYKVAIPAILGTLCLGKACIHEDPYRKSVFSRITTWLDDIFNDFGETFEASMKGLLVVCLIVIFAVCLLVLAFIYFPKLTAFLAASVIMTIFLVAFFKVEQFHPSNLQTICFGIATIVAIALSPEWMKVIAIVILSIGVPSLLILLAIIKGTSKRTP
jgi:hypothetical protein